MPKQTKLPQYKTQERKLEKLLLSQGYANFAWEAEMALMSDADKTAFAALVDDYGMVTRGSREIFQTWKQDHIRKVRGAMAANAAEPANETGENASE